MSTLPPIQLKLLASVIAQKIAKNLSKQQIVPKPKRGVKAVMGVIMGLKCPHNNKVLRRKF
jgi:hypothetical protein